MTDWCFITCCVSSSDIISQVLSPQVPGDQAHVKIWLIMLILCDRDGNWLEFWGPPSCRFLPNYESHWNKICSTRVDFIIHIMLSTQKASSGPSVQMTVVWFLQSGWRASMFLWRRSLWTALLRSTSWKWSWRRWTRHWACRMAAGSSGMSNVSHVADYTKAAAVGEFP